MPEEAQCHWNTQSDESQVLKIKINIIYLDFEEEVIGKEDQQVSEYVAGLHLGVNGSTDDFFNWEDFLFIENFSDLRDVVVREVIELKWGK